MHAYDLLKTQILGLISFAVVGYSQPSLARPIWPERTAKYITVDAPGQACYQTDWFCVGTNLYDINLEGVVLGSYPDADGNYHDFTRYPWGKIEDAKYFFPSRSNALGSTTGYYVSKEGQPSLYRRTAQGALSSFWIQGELYQGPSAINDKNAVIWTACCHRGTRSYRLNPDGSVHTVDIEYTRNVVATGINLFGVVTGWYTDNHQTEYGFVAYPDGKIRKYDSPAEKGAMPSSISLDGTVAGAVGYHEGFIREPNGRFTTFNAPGAAATDSAIISPTGIVTGNALPGPLDDGSRPASHGYIRYPDGKMKLFDPPGSIWTYVTGINALGVIIGHYADASLNTHGFIRLPANPLAP